MFPKNLSLILTILLVGCSTSSCGSQQKHLISCEHSYADMIEKAEEATVSIFSVPLDVIEDFVFSIENPTTEIEEVQPILEHASGTGWIIKKEGVIVTNAHVVDQEDSLISIKMKSGIIYFPDKIIKSPRHDVAFLFITPRDELMELPLGDSDLVRKTDRVFIIGHPFNLKYTISTGIVAYPKRQGTIQLDADINPGNSGGPILNTEGKVIGMSMAYANGRISFGVQINTIKFLYEKAIEVLGYEKILTE